MLTLPIKRQWYDMILCGQKREEYREDNPYYRSRFEKLFDLSPEALADPVRQKASVLRLRNGFSSTEKAVRSGAPNLESLASFSASCL